MLQLMWFRNDLRVKDNSALSAAMLAGPTLALFVVTPEQWRRHDEAACKIDFWMRNLAALKAELQILGVPLLIRHAQTWDDIPAVLADTCRTHGVQHVHANEEYGINEGRRDTAVDAQLTASGTGFTCHVDQVLFAPGSILNRSGGYFQVFSQFRKACWQRLHSSLPPCTGKPRPQQPLAVEGDDIPTHIPGFCAPAPDLGSLWPAGEQSALLRLQRFTDEALPDYHRQRDMPAYPGTSKLSPYLASGVLSIRQCLHAALQVNQGEFDSGNEGVVTWINELLWREFYKHILAGFPRVSRHRAFRSETEAIPWRDAPEDLQAWQQGNTGFPLIDAAMRQLLATGWMHNRLRMVTAMFLTKNLLIDWREGERFFMRHLIDGDLAANNGGWQWSASTGTDAVPWFRIFNPVTQSRRFDPEGRFIRQWIPELAHLDNHDIHLPPQGTLFSSTRYPAPMVDLKSSRQRALEAFRGNGRHAS